MTDHEAPRSVVVVGAGIVGCAAAHALAPAHDVTVLEKDAVASGATGKASGLVSPVYDHGDHPAAARYATDFFRAFDGTGRFTFHERDGVFLVGDDELDHAREAARTAEEAGFDADYLSLDALHERYPGTFGTDRFAAAVVFEDAGWVDPHSFALALKEAAVDAGAAFETGVEVTGVETDGQVRGVRTAAGRLDADAVVVAAGWRTRDLLSGLVEVPIRPFRYQTMTLETGDTLDECFPVTWEHDVKLYWRSTLRGNLHVGGRPYFVSDPGAVRERTTDDFRRLVAARIPEYVPGVGETRVVTEGTCPTGDAASPDGVPIVDAPAGAPDGLVVATGMHGFGIMLAPVVAAAARAHVTGVDPPFPLEPYALDRFDDRSGEFGSSYVREL